MTTVRVYGDSRLTYITPYIEAVNNTQAKITIDAEGGATIRSTASAIWANAENRPYDNNIFISGINDLTVWDGATATYKLAFATTEEACDYMIASYQEFELKLHTKYPTSILIFGQLTGIDLAAYPYIQDYDPDHQRILNDTVTIVNRELVKINQRNWVPTCWTGKHVHQNRHGRRTNYYRLLTDGLHPSEFLLRKWAMDICNTAYRVT